MTPDIKDMLYLVAIEESGSQSRAADFLGVSRQAVAKAVSRLETAAGMRLFRRSGTRLVATDRARGLIEAARRVLAEYDMLAQTWMPEEWQPISKYNQNKHAVVSIAITNLVVASEITRPLQWIVRNVHSISARIHTDNSAAVAESVRKGSTNIGIIDGSSDNLPGLETVVLFPLAPHLLAPHGHELANRPGLIPSDVDDVPMITPDAGSSLYHMFVDACGAWDVQPNIRIRCNSADAAMHLREKTGLPTLAARPPFIESPAGHRAIPLDLGANLSLLAARSPHGKMASSASRVWEIILRSRKSGAAA